MVDCESDLIEYYPSKYKLNTFNKRYFWECSPILPHVSTKKIKDTCKELKISKDEKYRNTFRKLIEIK